MTAPALSRPRRLAERERTLLAFERRQLSRAAAQARLDHLDRHHRPPDPDPLPPPEAP